jgi:hypothetical protein
LFESFDFSYKEASFLLLTCSFLYIQTACADGVVRVFKLDEASSKSFKYESQVPLMQYQILHQYHANSFSLLLTPYILLHFCRFLRINLPAGGHPTAVAFSDGASSIVVASQMLAGSSLYMYGEVKAKASDETKQQAKLPLPGLKWEHHKVHEKRAILTLVGTTASYGSADGSTILASCSEGILLSFILEKLCALSFFFVGF